MTGRKKVVNTCRCLIGDFACTDDTGLVGEAEEARAAEQLFLINISNFAGRVNAEKTGGFWITSQLPPQFEVSFLGEAVSVKHVGALLGSPRNHTAERQTRIGKTVQNLGCKAQGRTETSNVI